MITRGYSFKSDTDTEVLINLIEDVKKQENVKLGKAVQIALNQVIGAYAIAVFDKNKPANADSLPVPLLVCIKFRGSVSDVTEAVEAGIRVAESMTGVVQHYVIPNPEPGTQKMLKISALDKD